jgi:hypothetical protein
MSFADGRRLTSGGPPFVVELLAVVFLSTKTLRTTHSSRPYRTLLYQVALVYGGTEKYKLVYAL